MEGHRIHIHNTTLQQLEQERTGGRLTRTAAARMQESDHESSASEATETSDEEQEGQASGDSSDWDDAQDDDEQGQADANADAYAATADSDNGRMCTHHLQYLGDGEEYQRLKEACLQKQACQLEVPDGIDSILALTNAPVGQEAYIRAVSEFTNELRKDRNYPFANKGQVNN